MSGACPEYGFEVWLQLAARDADVTVTDFVRHLEGLGLSAAGGGDDDAWHFVITRVGSQATDADRGAVEAWARGRRGISALRSGPIVDLTGELD